jgi:hypothetical protein
MATNSQVSDLAYAALAAQLASPNRQKFILSLHQQSFNNIRLKNWMISKLGGMTQGVQTVDGKVTAQIMKTAQLTAVIASTTQSGANLILTLTTNVGTGFRPSAVVLDKNGLKSGMVVATSTNSVTLAPLTGETLTAGTDFLVGEGITEGYIVIPNEYSDAVKGRKNSPDTVEDYLQIFRVNRNFSRRNYAASYIDQALRGGASAQEAVRSGIIELQMNDMSYDMMVQEQYAYIFGKKGVQVSENQDSNTQMGYIQAVNERGGIGIKSTTKATFESCSDQALRIFENSNAQMNEVFCLAGSAYKANVIKDAQKYKLTAGTGSVLEGSGIAFKTWETGFGKLTMIDNDLFNDKNLFPTIADTGYRYTAESALFLSVSSAKDVLGRQISPIQDFYGSYGGNSEGVHMTATNGIIGSDGKFQVSSANQLDGNVVGQVMDKCSMIVSAQGMGYDMYIGS